MPKCFSEFGGLPREGRLVRLSSVLVELSADKKVNLIRVRRALVSYSPLEYHNTHQVGWKN